MFDFNLDPVTNSFNSTWQGVIDFLPEFIIAIVVLIIGWFVAYLAGDVVRQIFNAIPLDKGLKTVGFDKLMARAGFSLNTGAFFGAFVKWFLIVVVFVAAFDILGLSQVNDYLKGEVLPYLPNIFVAAIILVFGAILAGALQNVVTGSAKAADIPNPKLMGGVAKWAVWIFVIVSALSRLGIAEDQLYILFTGLVAMLALAGGIAFGLGGKEQASSFLSSLRKDISHR